MPMPRLRPRSRIGSDWVVLDGYQFDSAYQAAIKDSGQGLLAMDDFGKLDRYVADIVVNQDPIAEERLYPRRETYTRLLLGTEYYFSAAQSSAACQGSNSAAPALPRRLLLTFGGSDPGRLTELALEAMDSVNVNGLETIIFIGPGNPRWEQINAAAQGRSDIRLLRDPSDIPDWMAGCDLAVISAGSTLWELAYCRVPCIVVMVDDAQAPAIEKLVERGLPLAGQPPLSCRRTNCGSDYRALRQSEPPRGARREPRRNGRWPRGRAGSGRDADRGSLLPMKVAMMQPTFLPWAGFFGLVSACDRFVFGDDYQYSAGSFHQRNQLFRNVDEQEWMIVPMQKKWSKGLPLNKAQIAEDPPWREKMWKRIGNAYRSAPFFARSRRRWRAGC